MDQKNKISKSKIASSAGWISIITNILLFVLKYWAGVVTGSVAIIPLAMEGQI